MQPETSTLLAAVTSPQPGNRRLVINRLIAALKQTGVWEKLDLLYVLAAADTQAAGLNWKLPGAFSLSAVNSPTFVADRGYTGNGSSSYLDTAWTPGTNAVQFQLNSAALGVYTTTDKGTAGNTIAVGASLSGISRINVRGLSDLPTVRLNDAGGGGQWSGLGPAGLYAVVRPDANTRVGYYNGTQKVTGSVASTVLPTSTLTICADHGASVNNYSVEQVSVVFAGAALSAGEMAAAFTALRTYLQTVGAV